LNIEVFYHDRQTKQDVTMTGTSELIRSTFGNKGCNVWKGIVSEENGNKYFIKYIDADEHSDNYDHNWEINVFKKANERFDKEALFHMRHPFITYIYQKCTADITDLSTGKTMKAVCLLEEYNNGITLTTFYSENVKNDKRIIFSHMLQMLYGMNYYTTVKKTDPIVHRDIKPDNIMVVENNMIKYIDFDWSHVYDSMGTRDTGERIGGSKYYAHPEQNKKNIRSFIGMDIYSLGLVFLYMLCHDHYKRLLEKNNYKNDDYILHRNLLCQDIDNELLVIIATMIAEKNIQYKKVKYIIDDFKAYLKKKYPDIYSEIMKELYEKYSFLPERSLLTERDIGIDIEICENRDDMTTEFVRKDSYFPTNGEICRKILLKGPVELSVFRAKNVIYVILVMSQRYSKKTVFFDFGNVSSLCEQTVIFDDYTFYISPKNLKGDAAFGFGRI